MVRLCDKIFNTMAPVNIQPRQIGSKGNAA